MLPCSNVQIVKCSNFQMSKCSNVQMFKCSNVSMFQCSNVPNTQMFKCANVQMSDVKCQMSNVNKVKLLSERTSGVPPVIFIFKACKIHNKQKLDNLMHWMVLSRACYYSRLDTIIQIAHFTGSGLTAMLVSQSFPYLAAHILKSGVAGVHTPQTIWNFPHTDCLRTKTI